MKYKVYSTKFGKIYVAADARGIVTVSFSADKWRSHQGAVSSRSVFPRVRNGGRSAELSQLRRFEKALNRYIQGEDKAFSKLPLSLTGTPFEIRVWQALRTIPKGKTWSYGEIARLIKHPRASRAVGTACGKNRLCLVVPCHRVVAAGCRLGGFTGGLALKRKLLVHEGVQLKREALLAAS